jgi:hypothetical protein
MAMTTGEPFVFLGCLEVRELVAEEVRDERELLAALERVPDEAIFSHTAGVLLGRAVLPEAYPNDFALWVATELRDRRLAERLAMVDLFHAGSIETVRNELVATVESHLRNVPAGAALTRGEPFFFVQYHLIPVPTGHRATTLREFRDALSEVDASALFFHLTESRYRQGRARGDFAEWLERSQGRPDLAERVARFEVLLGSLERIRDGYLTVLGRALEEGAT